MWGYFSGYINIQVKNTTNKIPLTDTVLRNIKPKEKQYKLTDTQGMYLLVTTSGGKYWRLKYRHAGKEKTFALGVYPEISLKEAREKRDEARKLIANGLDPSQEKKEKRLKQYLHAENSFEKISREWREHQTLRWTKRHAEYVLRRIEADIFPFIGSRPINGIMPPELLAVLRQIEKRGAIDIAHRALQTCGQIFRYAIATGRADRDICADLRGALKTRKKENYARLEAKELPELLGKIEEYDGDFQTSLALKLLLLTFVRSGELRGARWEEIDFEKAEWRIPAERMKMRDPHIVPLSTQALSVLRQLEKIRAPSHEHIFPNRNKPMACISENTLLYALYRMGYHSRATPHGFRATASTILNEYGFRSDVIERQLAHAERNKVRAS